MTLKEKLSEIKDFAGYALDSTLGALWKIGTRVALPAYITIYMALYLGSQNGCLDSQRTKSAERYYRTCETSVKTVKQVSEEWRDNETSFLDISGFNPQVIRTVEFEDGSKSVLSYRTMAHQPLVRWIRGEEFNPKPGEKYEVTSQGGIVRKN